MISCLMNLHCSSAHVATVFSVALFSSETVKESKIIMMCQNTTFFELVQDYMEMSLNDPR